MKKIGSMRGSEYDSYTLSKKMSYSKTYHAENKARKEAARSNVKIGINTPRSIGDPDRINKNSYRSYKTCGSVENLKNLIALAENAPRKLTEFAKNNGLTMSVTTHIFNNPVLLLKRMENIERLLKEEACEVC